MTFGQPSGPPATAKQVQHLLALLQAAGHADFRDARGPMGFTQRQAGGKFTRDEAEAFIEQLEAGDRPGSPTDTPEPATSPAHEPAPARPAARRSATPGAATGSSNTEQALRKVPSTLLAAELQRRGWVVMEP
jgi:hypothetical protein